MGSEGFFFCRNVRRIYYIVLCCISVDGDGDGDVENSRNTNAMLHLTIEFKTEAMCVRNVYD